MGAAETPEKAILGPWAGTGYSDLPVCPECGWQAAAYDGRTCPLQGPRLGRELTGPSSLVVRTQQLREAALKVSADPLTVR